MLKIFLVEDEFIVREGIKKKIDWEAKGYEFVGEASDGELAFPMIQKEKPDIVITDIRMPFMDGLTLSKMVKQILPSTEIIVLTGHEEFEYAKEALKIGIAEYLTKPISSEGLLAAVEEVAVKIEEKRKEEEILQKYKEEMEEDSEGEKKQLFLDIVSGSSNVSELYEKAYALNIDLSAIWYNIILVKVHATKRGPEEYSDRIVKITERLKELEKNKDVLFFDRNLEGCAFLLKADSKELLEEAQEQYISQMCSIFEEYNHVAYFIGVGSPTDRLREVQTSFEQASHAFAHRFFSKNSQVVYFDHLSLQESMPQEEVSIKDVDVKHFERDRIRDFIHTGDYEETKYFVEEFFNNIGNGALESKMFRQYLAMDVYFCVTEFLDEVQQSQKKELLKDPGLELLGNAGSVIAYVEELICYAISARNQVANNRYSNVVQEAISYIEANYADEELSLNSLASHVNFSPNHLSTIFSQQTGQSFIKYLTEYRMGKAKELLRCTNKRSSVVAQEVGYKDAHYFSYLFKKEVGMTPTQYRGGTS